jgi:hypothetical protein
MIFEAQPIPHYDGLTFPYVIGKENRISKMLTLHNVNINDKSCGGMIKLLQVKRDELDDGIESFLVEEHREEGSVIVHYKIIDFVHETKKSDIIYG